jgi:endonuclease/exonuclease/phosphatase family metal-dependent hydrolase
VAATLRVVSWNIRAAIGTGPFPDRWWSRIDADRLRAIGAFVSGLDADLVALQEVAICSRDGELVDQPGDLARQLGMDVRFGAVRSFAAVDARGRTVGGGLFGNALLTRAPLEDARTVALPMAPGDALVEPAGSDRPHAGTRYADAPPDIREPRCLLLATVDGWRVGTAHFSHVGSGERLLQARACIEAFGDESPALLLGDLNAPIDAAELDPLTGWTDAFAGPPDDEARTSTDDGWRIDHVLVRGASVHEPARVLRESGDLSDHYPVVAELRHSPHASPHPTR